MSKKKSQLKAHLLKKYQQISEPQCCCSKEKSSTSIRCNKNRVTIFGQLGQTENNKYTLEYAAKINNTPTSPEFFSQYYNTTDDQENSTHNFKEVTSHAVQVNIRERWEKPDRRLTVSNDQAIQCNFERLSRLIPDVHDVDGTEENNVLKKCNSPVIVISVYPRPGVKISTDQVLRKSKPTARKYFSNLATIENTKKSRKKDISQNRRSKSRSASPVVKNVDKNKTEDNLQSQKAPGSKIKKKFNINRISMKSEPHNVNKNYTTDIKQTLIDNFIKSMESEDDNYAKFLLSVPKSTASKITIDLNKNKQHYDDALDVNKKEVDIEGQKDKFKDPNDYYVTAKKLSISNDKNIFDKPSPSTNKFGKMNTKSNYSKPMHLKPRDSLVVNHSREIHRSEIRTSVQDNINNNNKSGNSGTTKHYRGDDCPFDDSNIRDKEIQRLLGVKKKQIRHLAKTSETYQKHFGFQKCSKTIIISVNRKRQPRSSFTLRANDDHNYEPLDKDVNCQDKLIKVKGLQIPPTTFYKTNKTINRVPKTLSHRNDKGTKINLNRLRNYDLDYLYSELQTKHPRLICDYDFFHAQKPYRYRRNRYNKTTMTAKNTAVNSLERNKDIGCSLLAAGSVKMERTYDKHFHRKIQTENKSLEKYAQTDKNLRNRRRFKMDRDSNYKINKNINNLLTIDSERIIIDQKKKICLRPTVSAIEVSNNCNFILESKTLKSYFKQKGDGQDLKSIKQVDHVNSLRVIYEGKGHKRSVTPNLGTSFLSISVNSSKATCQKSHKRRKTFLWHILSCVKLQRNSNIIENDRLNELSTANTVGSYYINTSLAPWDMSSVLFDTSASYYSSHSLHTVTKIKRGFFTSLCDFFARRKRQIDKWTLDSRVNT